MKAVVRSTWLTSADNCLRVMVAVALQFIVMGCEDKQSGDPSSVAGDDESEGGSDTQTDDAPDNGETDDTETDDTDDAPDTDDTTDDEPDTDDTTDDEPDTDDTTDDEPDTDDTTDDEPDTDDTTDESDTDDTTDTGEGPDSTDDSGTGDPGTDDGGSGGTTGVPSEAGESDRGVEAQASPQSAPGVVATDNGFEVDAKDQLRWFFVVENTSDTPACGGLGPARLYDQNDVLLAGGSSDTHYLDPNLPAFFVTTHGTLFRDPASGLRNCIPAGGRGIGVGDFGTPSGYLSPGERDQLLSKGARIEFDLDLAVTDASLLEAADDLFELSNQKLTDTPEGKVASATITGHTKVIGLQFYAALFDGDAPVDLVNMAGGQIEDGTSRELAMPPGNPKATRFELYVHGSLPR